MSLHRIEDSRQITEFEGELVSSVASSGHAGRWVVLEVYALDGGGWLIHRVGDSRIYHRADTLCRTRSGRTPGEPGTPRDLKPDAEPCPVCEPPYPERLEPGEQIRAEIPQHSFTQCDSPDGVIYNLTHYRDGKTGIWITRTSKLTDELIGRLAAASPDFRGLGKPVETITPVTVTARDAG